MNKRMIVIVAVGLLAIMAVYELPKSGNIKYAPLVVKMSVSELTTNAAEIIEGTVVKELGTTREADPNDGQEMVYTRYQIKVDNKLKGTLGSEVVVRVAGGRYLTTEVDAEDQPTLEVGEKIIAFLNKVSDTNNDYIVTGGFQGSFEVNGSEAVQDETEEKFVAADLISQIKAGVQSTKKDATLN